MSGRNDSIVKSALNFLRLAAAIVAVALATPAHAVTDIQWWHAMSGQLGIQSAKAVGPGRDRQIVEGREILDIDP